MNPQANHFNVVHGSMTISVPRNIFKGDSAEPVPDKISNFSSILKGRYPWLSDNAIEVILKNAKKELISIMEVETKGMSIARVKESNGDIEGAIKVMEKWAKNEPECIDIWYYLGHLYFSAGKKELGQKAMNKGKSLI